MLFLNDLISRQHNKQTLGQELIEDRDQSPCVVEVGGVKQFGLLFLDRQNVKLGRVNKL